jgi:hypothetical protein
LFLEVFIYMKVIITESQVEKVINVFSKFLNKDSRKGVCNVTIDYDDMMDRFVLNIFFDRMYLVNLDSGGKQTNFIVKVVNEYGNLFRSLSSKNPLIYQHYDDC